MEQVLIIAYGNPLRCDDGIAWQAAEELKRELAETAKIICVHQLTPELAQDISRAKMVIFLDASRNDASRNGDAGRVRCEVVTAGTEERHFGHHVAPAGVLALSEQLYCSRPQAFLISIHGECFDHGQDLSATAVRALPHVVAEVCKLMRQLHRAFESLERANAGAVSAV